jgi:succinate dehydrogenase / fumarate reductase, membrane anchor subunit
VMQSNSSMRTPMAKVRGLGSAKSGTEHFFRQRMTALANVPLAIAFVILLTMLLGAPHAAFVNTMKNPLIALILLLFVVSGMVHMRLGMQVIIEDYVHEEGRKIALLIANTFFAIVIGAACILAVLKMALS